jgi:DNA-binding response OmpR family regulator
MDQRTVLVVEDDVSIRELLTEVLNDAGYDVLVADHGRAVLQLAHQHAPAVAVVDHVLPDMSGLDVLERLRGCPFSRYVPVMLITGRAQQIAARNHGADRLLAKPFDIDVLLEHVDALACSAMSPSPDVA